MSSGGFRGGMGGITRGGFGGANNMGGPNMMYTYEIKPLNHSLEQRPTTADIEINEIKVGSMITGNPVKSNANPGNTKIKGIVQQIVKTDNNSIKYYIVFDEATATSVKIEPLSAQLVVNAPMASYNSVETNRYRPRRSFVRESICINETYDITEATTDVKDKVKNSRKLPKEMKEKIFPLIMKKGIHGTQYKNGVVTHLKYSKSGVGLGADKNGFFVFTHRARSKSYKEIDKIPEKDIKFIESTG